MDCSVPYSEWTTCKTVKGKDKGNLISRLLSYEATSAQKRSGMTRIVQGLHRQFYLPSTPLSTYGMYLCLPRRWFSFTDPGGMEG